MSTFPFEAQRQFRQYFREIDNHHANQLMAKSSQQLEKFAKQQVLAQLKQAEEATKLHYAQNEANSILRESLEVSMRGFSEVICAVENLADAEGRTTEAVHTLSGIVAHGLQRLSQQSSKQHQEALEIAKNPVRTEAQELAKAAENLLKLGAELKGPDQDNIYREAMQALREVTANPIGNRDYITCFHIGFLLWKSENNLAEAEKAFDRARFLSLGTKDVWHLSAIRHLAEMRHLQGRHQEAFDTIKETLASGLDHNFLFDAARYAARASRQDDFIDLLEDCIELQPITINTMFGEADFTATPASQAALYELRDRLLQKKRAELRQDLRQLKQLRAIIRQAEDKAEITFQLPPSLVYELAELEDNEKELAHLDYLKILAKQATAREASDLLEKTIKQALELKLREVENAEGKAQVELNKARESIERRLTILRLEKNSAEDDALHVQDRVTLPERPEFGRLSPKKPGDKSVKFPTEFIVFCIVVPPIGILSIVVGGIMHTRAMSRWQSECDNIRREAKAAANRRLEMVNATYPDKEREIKLNGQLQLASFENVRAEAQSLRRNIEQALRSLHMAS